MSNEQKLEDFGEHIAGAKKETYFRVIDTTSEEAKALPLSKLWADKDIKAIKDIEIASIAHTLKDALPNRPRNPYKLNRWLGEVSKSQKVIVDLIKKNDPAFTDTIMKELEKHGDSKAYLLTKIDREDWKKVGDVRFLQNTNENNTVYLSVQLKGERFSFYPKETANIQDYNTRAIINKLADEIQNTLKDKEKTGTREMTASSFDIYTRTIDNTAFICAKTDRQKTPLVEFATLKEAREYKKDLDNITELARLWTEHREFNSIAKSDMRNAVNEERTGQSYRDHDITPDEFMATFGIRGGQFGNWVTGDERQEMLNRTYDGLMDLSKALNVKPKAIGLNGTLGIAFGARGSGNASAHYEPSEQVINLTKTRGAGSLAHEWWHALDHYMKNGDNLLTHHLNANSTARHQELINPVRELVQDIHKSELYGRSQKADAYRSQPYFATDVEMTARAFEGHIQHTLSTMGIKNDFLVNIKAEKDWQKNLDAYPYPRTNELEAFGKAYNAIFDTLKEVDKEFVPTHYEPEPIIHADTLAVQEIENKQAKIKETRTSWGDFPPVISNGAIKDLSKEPEYIEAKSGDFEKSAQLVERLLKDETIQEVKKMIGDNKPIIVPILSEEAIGKNRIPQATAYALAKHLGLQVDSNIYQLNTAKRTNTGIYHRYVAPPEFAGQVKAGQSYLIVDDTLSVGGTIATLKGYIENQGGKVIGATVMTAYDKKMDIIIKPNMLQSLENKQGLKEYWFKEFGYDIDKLTQQEAGHLKKPTLEQISERVQEARHALEQQKETSNEQHSTSHETQQREVYQAPAFEPAKTGGTDSLQPAGGGVLQSILRQEESSNSRLSTQNTYINCPYAEKDQAKALGAKWDNINKSWYVPQGTDLSKFEKWLPQERQAENSAPSNDASNRIYLYTQPSDNPAIQELKTQGIVKFDLQHKLWFAHKDNQDAVQQWTTRPYVPTPEQALTEHLRNMGIDVGTGHPIFDERPHRLANEGSTDKNVMYHAYPNPNGVPYARITNFSRNGVSEWTYPTEHLLALRAIEAVERANGGHAPIQSSYIPKTATAPRTQQVPQKDPEKITLENKMAERAKMLMSFAPVADTKQNYLAKKQVTANNVARIVPDSSAIPEHLQAHIAIGNTPKQYFYLLTNNPDDKLVLQRGNLVIPQTNAQGEIRAFETIAYNSRKYALKDAEKKSMMTTLGCLEDGKPIIMAEGYATGATLYENTRQSVVVAFGKNGLMDIAKELRSQYPNSKIYIGADNDHTKKVNAGLIDAVAVQQAVQNVHILAPQFEKGDTGKDWNDILVDKGIDELKRQIKEQLAVINPQNVDKTQAQLRQPHETIQKHPLDPDVIRQNHPTMSEDNINAIQLWRNEISLRYADEPIRAQFALSRLENRLPQYAQGEVLPFPKLQAVEQKPPESTMNHPTPQAQQTDNQQGGWKL